MEQMRLATDGRWDRRPRFLFALVIQIKAKRAELALCPLKRQTSSGEMAVSNDKFGRERQKMQTGSHIGFRIRTDGQKKGGLRVGNVRREGGIAQRGAIGAGSLRNSNRRRIGRARRVGSGIEFTSM
jgi:hypothetical protein